MTTGTRRNPRRLAIGLVALATAGAALCLVLPRQPAAQEAASDGGAASPRLPNQFDPHLRLPVAQIPAATPIRFLTDDDYPPFQMVGPGGTLSGFNVDLARALCEEIGRQCTIQPRRWDTLLDALADRSGDAVIAGMKATPELLRRADVTLPYIKTPGRFIVRRDDPHPPLLTPAGIAGHAVAVASGTAHEAFLAAFFPGAARKPATSMQTALEAVAHGEAQLAFVDGPTAAVWLGGEAGGCCAFAGGPYLEGHFFGEGMVIAVRKGDDPLRRVLNSALQKLSGNGRLGDIYLQYFPIGFY